MDTAYMAEVFPLFVGAGITTLWTAAAGIALSIGVGLLCSIITYNKIPVLRVLVSVYIELSRNTPLLVQLFFLYYGLPKLGLVLSAEACGIIGLTFLGGSYMAEAFRSGLESVDRIQYETAQSLGFTGGQIMKNVVLPQALSVSMPALAANVIFLIKETSVFSAIALADLMYVTKDLIGLHYQTMETLLLLVISYLCILLPVSIAASIIERRMRHAGFGD